MPNAIDRIGPYQLIHKLGAGGFGEVWLAQDFSGSISREVAVKIPLNSEIDLDALLQEATLWARASGHLNVLEFLAARVFDGQVVLVSEYTPDGSLKDWLSRHGGRAPSVEAAVEMTRGILAGLEHLHARSIIHRDIKPDNVLLLGATPRLADFGISRVLKSTGKNTFIAGTPHYMAPEAFNRRRNQQADLWSVGVMLYQMLSGRLPFDGNDWAELYGAILNENPEPLPTAVPEWLRQVVAKSLAKEPERRYQNAQEMQEALRQIERDIEAEIAERERREAERRRLEYEERKRREEEDRRREIEQRRQIEEAARLQALQEDLRRKEEELANLKRVLPHEAVTAPIVGQPVADERRIDQEKAAREAAAAAPAVRRKTPRVALGAITVCILVVTVCILIAQITTPHWEPVNLEPVNPKPDIAESPEPSAEIANVEPPSKASKAVTETTPESEKGRLLGKHPFSLQWISWEHFGTVIVSEDKDTISVKGEQRSRENDDYVTINGVILEIAANKFKFQGKIVTKISYINSGKPCNREGIMTFSVTGNRKYWRLQEMDNPCDTATDYVDIYMRP